MAAILDVSQDDNQLSTCSPSNLVVNKNESITNSLSIVTLADSKTFGNDKFARTSLELGDSNFDDFYANELSVKVDDVRKHFDVFETYVSYRITLNVLGEGHSEYKEKEYVVRRRYNDFVWLRNKLIEAYPTRLIPSLPGKHSLLEHLDKYSEEFIKFRKALLDKFLQRLVKHPIISYDKCLKFFLSANITEFQSFVKSHPAHAPKRHGNNFLSNLLMENKCIRYNEFECARRSACVLHDKLKTFEKILERVMKERKELAKYLNQWAITFNKWSSSEVALQKNLSLMSNSLRQVSSNHENFLVGAMRSTVLQPLREYILYVECVKEAFDRRESIKNQYDLSLQQEDNSQNNQNLQDLLEIANEDMRSELGQWSKERTREAKSILLSMSDLYVKFYESAIEMWENSLLSLDAKPNEE